MKTVGNDGKPVGVLIAAVSRSGCISDYSCNVCVKDGTVMTFKEARQRGYVPLRSAHRSGVNR